MATLEFVLKRMASAVVVLFGVTVITFLLARTVPSNPAALYLGPRARPDDIAEVAKQMGLDQPLPVQYGRYMGDLLQGDLGISISSKQPVVTEILGRLPATLELLFVGMFAAIISGILIGVVAARWRGKAPDVAGRSAAILGVSIPAFFLGILLQLIFFRWLGLLPLAGRVDANLRFISPIADITGFYLVDTIVTSNWAAFRDAAIHLILPAVTLAAFPAGLIARMVRGTMVEVMSLDYVRTMRAYGLGENRIAFKYALKNALGPAVSVIGLSFAYALTGSFFVEVIFNWPGLGQYTVRSLLSLDYPAVMGITLIGATAYIFFNIVVDLAQARLDPRVSLE